MSFPQQDFNQLSLILKTLIVIGSISSVVFLVLLVVIISLMFESKQIKKEQDLAEYDDFLNEFTNGKKLEKSEKSDNYPVFPKIKDLDGHIFKNLMQIDIV